MARSAAERVAYGDAVVARFAAAGAPATLRGDVKTFKARHTAYVAAQKAVTRAKKTFDDATARVGALDSARDKTVLAIADKLPGAGLGARNRPFAEFTTFAVSKLVDLPLDVESSEVEKVLVGITGKKPPADITKLIATARAQSAAVDAALTELDGPVQALNKVRTTRDLLVPDWDKGERRLRDAAKVAYRDDPATLKGLFVEPGHVVGAVEPRRRAKKPPPTPPTDGTAPPPVVTLAAKKRPRQRHRLG